MGGITSDSENIFLPNWGQINIFYFYKPPQPIASNKLLFIHTNN